MSTHAATPQAPPAARGSGSYHGPSAVGDDLRRFLNLTWTLAITDFKLRYFGSVLGYVWSLMRPLMLFGVLYAVFTQIVRVGSSIPNYPLYLLTSIVLWTYFAETTSAAVNSLVNRENLLRKVRFPRLVIPLSVALTSLFNLALNLVVVFIFILASGIEPRASWLGVPLLALALVVLGTGVAMLVSALYVRYRDVGPIWEVVLQLGFWGSPVIYAIGTVPSAWQAAMMCNPVAVILTEARLMLIDPNAPSAADAIGGAERLLIPLGIVLIVFVAGWMVFKREAPRIAENL